MNAHGATMFAIKDTHGAMRFVVDPNVHVCIGGSTPHNNAVLDIQSTTHGFLPPRMTTKERDLMTDVPVGLMVYDVTTNALNIFNGTAWKSMATTKAGWWKKIFCCKKK